MVRAACHYLQRTPVAVVALGYAPSAGPSLSLSECWCCAVGRSPARVWIARLLGRRQLGQCGGASVSTGAARLEQLGMCRRRRGASTRPVALIDVTRPAGGGSAWLARPPATTDVRSELWPSWPAGPGRRGPRPLLRRSGAALPCHRAAERLAADGSIADRRVAVGNRVGHARFWIREQARRHDAGALTIIRAVSR